MANLKNRFQTAPWAQFWLIYLDLMEHHYQIHIAFQENNYTERIIVWEYFLSFHFAMNDINYPRYGSYYVQSMKYINHLYPGLKQILENNCMSVQVQYRYTICTSIDQRGEQTLNKDAKTAGGVRGFAANQPSVLRWNFNNRKHSCLHKSSIRRSGFPNTK